EDEEESLKGYGVENLPSGLNQDNVAYVIYTSGSTGRPKGVACTHRAVMNLLDDFEKRQQLGSGDSCALWTSGSFDVSVYEIFSALTRGAELQVVPEELKYDGEGYIEWLASRRITSAYVPPFNVVELKEYLERNYEKSSLRRLLVGVEPIEQALL